MQQISATDAAAQLAADPDNTVLLDVREDMELQIASVAGAVHMPMGQIPARIEELAKDKTILCLCHIGGRSAQVTHFLSAQGYNAINVAGGIDAWSQLIDPSIPRY